MFLSHSIGVYLVFESCVQRFYAVIKIERKEMPLGPIAALGNRTLGVITFDFSEGQVTQQRVLGSTHWEHDTSLSGKAGPGRIRCRPPMHKWQNRRTVSQNAVGSTF